ncbi:glycine cleavage system protein GcvH [Desulfofalx alkaliphila]|uniref:glycine cleavage system protein GcvH n=1 Tax=Desulfofalx alkaliphila TaxID=105483 RepID=UPI0004E26F38|nr:glycine cleavage system protein GcvH [Desulfofalx alkaliphila]
MSKVPVELKYSNDHEWVLLEGNRATVGITDYAQQSLGDIVFLELPQVDDIIEAGDAFGVVESVKAASDLMMPLTGKVIEVNEELMDSPEIINEDPYEKGWMIVVEFTDASQIEDLLSSEQYEQLIEENA